MSKNDISRRDTKLLWGQSGALCAICKTIIIESKENNNGIYPIGVMAHIEGDKPGSARYNKSMIDKERSSYENHLLVCPICHTKIDNDPEKFTVEKLKKIKKEHEQTILDKYRNLTPEITFAELEVIVKYLVTSSIPEGTFTIIPPAQKIKRNNLSAEVENMIKIGMIQKKQVEKYLKEHPDYLFSDRLRTGFVLKYDELKNIGYDGDSLFYSLLDFASNSSPDFKIKEAGLAVLTHFFEICVVFEK